MSIAILILMHLVIGSSTFMYVIHRGYYMAARRYEISLRVLKYFFNTRREISYLQAAM